MSKYGTHPELAKFELKIGLLRFDGSTSVECSAGAGYKVVEVVVKGLTPATATSQSSEAKAALKAAIEELDKQDVMGITGESALMLPLQGLARTMTKTPIYLSALLQAALLIPAHSKEQTFVVFTKYAKEVEAQKSKILKDCGVTMKEERFAVEQVPENSDANAIVQKVKAMQGSNPKLAGCIFDCEELIKHADEVRAVTSFPVFDQVTLLDFFGSACSDNPYFGTCYKDLKGGDVEKLVTKSQRKLFSPYENFKTSLTSNVDKDAKIGVLRIDYSYPPIPGDTACAASYGYKVVFRSLTGLTFEKCQNGVLDESIQQSFQKAVKELEDEGVVAITGDCGFLMAYQPYVRALTETPVVLSSILQAPMFVVANAPDAKFAVFTANSTTFDKEKLLTQSGMQVDPKQWIVVGLQDLDGFEAVALGQKVPAEKVQPGIVKCVKDLQKKEPNLRGILLECTELPHYADAIRAEAKLPVVDAITIVDYFQNACTATPSFSKKVLQTFIPDISPTAMAASVGAITVGTLGVVTSPLFVVGDALGVNQIDAGVSGETQPKKGGCCNIL